MKQHKQIKILDTEQFDNGWQFAVATNGFTYKITLTADYYQHLTNGSVEPQRLIEVSMQFLLDRESPEEILREFNLRQINQYFKDYETIIIQSIK